MLLAEMTQANLIPVALPTQEQAPTVGRAAPQGKPQQRSQSQASTVTLAHVRHPLHHSGVPAIDAGQRQRAADEELRVLRRLELAQRRAELGRAVGGIGAGVEYHGLRVVLRELAEERPFSQVHCEAEGAFGAHGAHGALGAGHGQRVHAAAVRLA